jgi:hypothetical protein
VPPAFSKIFKLHIPVKEKIVRSKVLWNAGNEIGVIFENVVLAGINAHAGDDGLARKMDRLEAEVADLRLGW